MNRYRVTVIYKSGRDEVTGAPSEREAKKLNAKYEALPTVRTVLIEEIKRRGHE